MPRLFPLACARAMATTWSGGPLTILPPISAARPATSRRWRGRIGPARATAPRKASAQRARRMLGPGPGSPRCAGPGVGTSVLGKRRARSSVSARARAGSTLVVASTGKRSAGPAGQRGGVAGESTPARALARGAPAEARFFRAATRAAGRRATGTVTAAASATPSSGAPARWLTARGRRASGVAAAPRPRASGAPASPRRRVKWEARTRAARFKRPHEISPKKSLPLCGAYLFVGYCGSFLKMNYLPNLWCGGGAARTYCGLYLSGRLPPQNLGKYVP